MIQLILRQPQTSGLILEAWSELYQISNDNGNETVNYTVHFHRTANALCTSVCCKQNCLHVVSQFLCRHLVSQIIWQRIPRYPVHVLSYSAHSAEQPGVASWQIEDVTAMP